MALRFQIESFFINSRESLLENSERNIVSLLGYPKIIARILQERFGKNSFDIARWLKEYAVSNPVYKLKNDDKRWFYVFADDVKSYDHGDLTLYDNVELYDALQAGEEKFAEEWLRIYKQDLSDDFVFELDKYDMENTLSGNIKEMFNNHYFFKNTLIEAIEAGEIKNLSPYRNLSFRDALAKYREKKVFKDKPPVKEYENGWRWIDVGPKCELIAGIMSHCGNSSWYSDDPQRTILVLFDQNINPHVNITYSPRDSKIYGDVGKASSEVKLEYVDYITDIAEFLGADFEKDKIKSRSLSVKLLFKNIATDIVSIPNTTDLGGFLTNPYDAHKVYIVTLKNGGKYITDANKIFNMEYIYQYVRDSPKLSQHTDQLESNPALFARIISEIMLHDKSGAVHDVDDFIEKYGSE